MIIELTRPAPSMTQLIHLLKTELGNEYSCKMFGVKQNSILVGKSFFHGAQISAHDKQISIQHSPPSALAGFISGLAMTELGVILLPFVFIGGLPTQSNINIFLSEIGGVIKRHLDREK